MNIYLFGIYLVLLFSIIKIGSKWIFYGDKKIILKSYLQDAICLYISYLGVNYIMNTFFNLSLKSDVQTNPSVYTDEPTF